MFYIINKIKDSLHLSDDNIKINSKSSFTILLPKEESMTRLQVMDFLITNLSLQFDHNSIGKQSSIGRLIYNDIKIYIKYAHNQRENAAGKRNEFEFIHFIDQHKDNVKSVHFLSSTHSIKIDNVTKCLDSSFTKSQQYSKSDIQLFSGNDLKCNISLKKVNAVRWESSKKRLQTIYSDFIQNHEKYGITFKPIYNSVNKFKMYKDDSLIPRVILRNIDKNILESSVFGCEKIKPIIIKEDFDHKIDYDINDGVLTINCNTIYSEMEDIIGSDDEPYFTFIHDISKPNGIKIISASKKMLYKNNKLIGNSIEIW